MRQLERRDAAAPRALVGEFGGAVGTRAGFGPDGALPQRRVMERLGLGVPIIAWHAARDSITEFVAWLAMLAGTCAPIANEVIQRQRSEVAELR